MKKLLLIFILLLGTVSNVQAAELKNDKALTPIPTQFLISVLAEEGCWANLMSFTKPMSNW
jgi:hypothetical protein